MSGWPISSQLFRVFSHASIAQLIALELSKSGNGRLLDDLDCGSPYVVREQVFIFRRNHLTSALLDHPQINCFREILDLGDFIWLFKASINPLSTDKY